MINTAFNVFITFWDFNKCMLYELYKHYVCFRHRLF